MDKLIESAAKIERVVTSADKGKKGNIIVATGRGGSGKSTFVA